MVKGTENLAIWGILILLGIAVLGGQGETPVTDGPGGIDFSSVVEPQAVFTGQIFSS